MSSQWTNIGTLYGLTWGNRVWVLDVAGTSPGLVNEAGRLGPLLSLDGISNSDRDEPHALGGKSLEGHELLFDRVQATYAPAGWHSLRVRASWVPRDESTIDLEVQIQAHSVDELRNVQIHVSSQLAEHSQVEPIGPGLRFGLAPAYLEFSHPDDTSSRDLSSPDRVRYGLFGYDLERGVVLRGRMRGTWLPARPQWDTVAQNYRNFLSQPLPLGI
jgi:hypothetical protein